MNPVAMISGLQFPRMLLPRLLLPGLLLPGLLLAALLLAAPLQAATMEGVTLDDSISVADATLTRNGTGIRKRFFIKLYVGSLYLAAPGSDAAAIVQADEPMAIQLDILSDLLTRDKMIDALNEGFDNATGGNTATIQPQIDQMLRAMQEQIRPGDRYTLAYEPGVGTHLSRNGDELSVVQGLPFKQALFGIWLSDKPAQESLKSAMLGS